MQSRLLFPAYRNRRSFTFTRVLLGWLLLLMLPVQTFAEGVVNSCTEADLRAALAGGGTVTFACDGTITLSSPLIISNNASLDGAQHQVVISGGGATRVFQVRTGVTFSLSRVTVANGQSSGLSGGGFFNEGNSRIFECTFSNNVAVGTVPPTFGGAIYHGGGELRVDRCTFVNNQASLGGAVAGKFTFNQPPPEPPSVFITNSTFFGNIAPSRGTAIAPLSSTFVVANCTIAHNESWAVSGGRFVNTILAFNGTNNGSVSADLGHNISTDASGNFTHPSSLQNTDPLLGPLADNGGRTLTMALLNGSPAIDSGDALALPATDQRGVARPYGYGCDIGAFETTDLGTNRGQFRFTSAAYTQVENNPTVIITVFRANGVAGAVSVDFSTAGGSAVAGSDYVATQATLTFADGEASKSLAITLLDDGVDEGTEAFNVVLANPGGGAGLTAPSTATVSILDDDTVRVVSSCTENALRDALTQPGRVQFACDGTITLSSNLVINTNVTIDGTDRHVTINGGGATRLFVINPGIQLGLVNLTLADGLALGTNGGTGQPGGAGEGGAIYNNGGTLLAADCAFLRNKARGGTGGPGFGFPGMVGPGGLGRGGAIYSRNGEITLIDCDFDQNEARGGTAGTGPSGSTGGQSGGGAIYGTASQLELRRCNVAHNVSLAGRGTRINGSLGGSGFASGGAVEYDSGVVRITRSVFGNNVSWSEYSADAQGGAIMQRGGSLSVLDSIFVANRAEGGFGLLVSSPFGLPGGSAYGGALHLLAGTADLVASTMASNCVLGGAQLGGNRPGSGFGGGVFSSAGLSLLNCTLAHNEARAGDGPAHGPTVEGAGFGGGVYNDSGVAVLTHATIAGNAARNSPGVNSFQQGAESGGGIFSGTNGLVTLLNTIVANSPAGSNSFGILIDGGGNLSSDASCNFTAPGSLNNTDPKLGPLADYSGPTPTMALLPGSPAIDAAESAACPATDQRGRARPVGPACDIGAFESGAPYTMLGRLNGYLPPFGTARIGNGSSTAWIDVSGQYALHGLVPGMHTIKPESALVVFVPKTRDVNVIGDTVGIDFASYRTNAIVISRLGPGAISAVYAGGAGVYYNVQLSSGLPASWNWSQTLLADEDGLIRWGETNSTVGPGRFFRVEDRR